MLAAITHVWRYLPSTDTHLTGGGERQPPLVGEPPLQYLITRKPSQKPSLGSVEWGVLRWTIPPAPQASALPVARMPVGPCAGDPPTSHPPPPSALVGIFLCHSPSSAPARWEVSALWGPEHQLERLSLHLSIPAPCAATLSQASSSCRDDRSTSVLPSPHLGLPAPGPQN